MFEVTVIEDSIAKETGVRLTTLQMIYPRYIHAELLTHRAFTRNSSSSRAIPVNRLAEMALAEMVTPIRWGKNQPGMQPSKENLEGEELEQAQRIWSNMAHFCAMGAQQLAELGLHKQWSNRPLEWFSNIRTIVTATDWSNWFALRAHPDAQDEIQHLAYLMLDAMGKSTTIELSRGEWHLPYVTEAERERHPIELLLKVSAARCARVSYMTHDGKRPGVEQDVALYERLAGSAPLHASPTEHQATPAHSANYRSRNFRGWQQHRELVESRLFDKASAGAPHHCGNEGDPA